MTTGCEAVHPGWGFLAERAEFAAACEDNDVAFVGPRPESIEAMGDKVRAGRSAAEAGLPLVPGSNGAATLDEVRCARGRRRLPASPEGRPRGAAVAVCASYRPGGPGERLPHRIQPRRRPRSRTARCTSRRRSSARATSRSRCSGMARAASSRSASATARSSVGTRSSSRRGRRRPFPEALAGRDGGAARRACEALRYRGAGTIEFLLDEEGASTSSR